MEQQNGMVLEEVMVASGSKKRTKKKRIIALVLGLVLIISAALFLFTGFRHVQRPDDLVDAYIQSMLTLDYSRHFGLFQPEFVEEKFTSHLIDNERSYEQGIERANREAKKLLPIGKMSLCYDAFGPVELTAEELAAFRDENTFDFSLVGLDANKIEKAMRCRVENICLQMSGRYTVALGNTEDFHLYYYEKNWYVEPDAMEDDLSLDLAETRDDRSFASSETISGQVSYCGEDLFEITDADKCYVIYFPETGDYPMPTLGEHVDLVCYGGDSPVQRIEEGGTPSEETLYLGMLISFGLPSEPECCGN